MLLNLLGWHWLIKLHRSQAYNSIIHHLYIILCIHHPEARLFLSPFIPPLSFFTSLLFPLVIIILFSVSMRVFFFLNLCTFFTKPLRPFPSGNLLYLILEHFIKILFIYHKLHPFKVYTSFKVAFSTFTNLYNHYHYLIPEHFHHPKEKPCTH